MGSGDADADRPSVAPRTGSSGKGRNAEFLRQVAEAILLSPDLTPRQSQVLAFMWLRYGNAKGEMWPKMGTVARYFGCHERKIRAHIDGMVGAEVLEKDRRTQNDGRFGTNKLTIDIDFLMENVPDLDFDARPNRRPENLTSGRDGTVTPLRPEYDDCGEMFGNVSEQDAPPARNRPLAEDRPQADPGPSDQGPASGRTEPGNYNQGHKPTEEKETESVDVEQDAREVEFVSPHTESGELAGLRFHPQFQEGLLEDASEVDRLHFSRTLFDLIASHPEKLDRANRFIQDALWGERANLRTLTARIHALFPQDDLMDALGWNEGESER